MSVESSTRRACPAPDKLLPVESAVSPRKIGGTPFCWQSKPALRRIREAFDATHNVESAIAVYVALTEIASNEESETFTTTHAWISSMSGASLRTVCSRLKDLAEIDLLKISTPKLRAPSTFTLLSVPQPLRRAPQPLPHVSQRANTASLRASEENNEERYEEKRNKADSKIQKPDKTKTANTPRNFIPD